MLAAEPDRLKGLTRAARTTALADLIVRYVVEPGWALERKYDGDRLMVDVVAGIPTAIGRDGQRSKHQDLLRSPAFMAAFSRLPAGDWTRVVFDCELVDGILWIFDLVTVEVEHVAVVTPEMALAWRSGDGYLGAMLVSWNPGPLFQLVVSATTVEDKAAMAQRCVAEGWEGLVAKRLDSAYRPGRCADWVKLKDVNEADCVVMELGFEGRDNAVLGVHVDGVLTEVGHASTHGKPALAVGDVVTIRYARFTEGGRLLFPRIQGGPRSDKAAADCTIDQLVPGGTRA